MVAGFDEMIAESVQNFGLLLYPTPALMGLLRVKCASINHKYRNIEPSLSQPSHTGLPNGGVPQGTICGPKCFMIYINDLSTPVPLYKYVDDSTLSEICEINSISLMQEYVNIAAEWTNNNDMKINSEKSKEMIISYAHGNIGNEVPNILIEGKVVERVDHVKLLGITLSNDWTWKRHVDNIVKKAGKSVYALSAKTSRC